MTLLVNASARAKNSMSPCIHAQVSGEGMRKVYNFCYESRPNALRDMDTGCNCIKSCNKILCIFDVFNPCDVCIACYLLIGD